MTKSVCIRTFAPPCRLPLIKVSFSPWNIQPRNQIHSQKQTPPSFGNITEYYLSDHGGVAKIVLRYYLGESLATSQ